MHLDELEDAATVFIGHPVAGLHLAAGVDIGFEMGEPLAIVHAGMELQAAVAAVLLGQDGVEGKRIGHRWSLPECRADASVRRPDTWRSAYASAT